MDNTPVCGTGNLGSIPDGGTNINISMNPNLLIIKDIVGTPLITKFRGVDSESRFNHNLANTPGFKAEWANFPITYSLNSNYYRCPEWKDIEWDKSVLLLGDSWAFGQGLDLPSTIASRLSHELNGIPVVNLGQTGTSWTFSWINSVRLVEAGIRPRAVIYIWTHTARYAQLLENNITHSHGAWDVDQPGLSREYAMDPVHSMNMSIEILRSIRTMWTCPQLHYTWSKHVELPGVHYLGNSELDKARDLIHPGPRSTAQWARSMAQELSSKIN
jgi:hypothetical protein